MHILKSYAVASLLTTLLAAAITLVAAPAEAIHCEFTEQGCGNGGGGGGGGDGPIVTITCPAGYQVYCIDNMDGSGFHCTCKKTHPDGGTP
ncbi:hypothetical protein [Myxococcus sp. SDU36]|uniref:hypothetical protein n=1 Tax=Myxococcus sp. SDU36 TaxID=2831967 RepID=UPI002543818B|nr:hypothetical protein [Myxococcus sp. SDU36]WIG93742.1 hypothetical protein KGD87_24610 [Myxococcus sp. SDU36]